MKRRIALLIVFAAVAAAGVLAALAIAPAAKAWAPDNLPPGWTIEHIHTVGTTTCPYSDRIWTAGRAQWSNPFCEDSPTFQQDFDAWVNSHYTAPATTTSTSTPATTAASTTDTAATSTTPTSTPTDTTVTTQASPIGGAPSPAVTDPVTTTDPVTSTTATVTVTVTTTDATLASRIDELAAQLQSLTSRVARLEKAGDAAWLAYLNATASGAKPAAAAEIARGTYLNAEYGLGAFAP